MLTLASAKKFVLCRAKQLEGRIYAYIMQIARLLVIVAIVYSKYYGISSTLISYSQTFVIESQFNIP